MTSLVKRADCLSETEIDDEIVVMRLDNGEFFALTGSGASIWRLIDGTRDEARIAAALASQFESENSTFAADVERFLVQLQAAGLLAAG